MHLTGEVDVKDRIIIPAPRPAVYAYANIGQMGKGGSTAHQSDRSAPWPRETLLSRFCWDDPPQFCWGGHTRKHVLPAISAEVDPRAVSRPVDKP